MNNMGLYYLYKSFTGLIFGNILGLIKYLLNKEEKPIWVSKFHYQYNPNSSIIGYIVGYVLSEVTPLS